MCETTRAIGVPVVPDSEGNNDLIHMDNLSHFAVLLSSEPFALQAQIQIHFHWICCACSYTVYFNEQITQ